MTKNSPISWTDHTFNPWHGCTKIAHPDGSGCDHCYAETQSIRYGYRTIWGKQADRRFLSDATWRNPLVWNADAQRLQQPAFVFCASMGDVFEDRRDLDEPRSRLFDLVGETPWLVWLLLTKRAEQMNRLAPDAWRDGWPSNVWAGTSVEHQAAANLRVGRLLDVPTCRHFLSVEPMLGCVDLSTWFALDDNGSRIDWVIVGGESGAGHRTLDLVAARQLIGDCYVADVPVWTKQDSGHHSGRQGRLPNDLWRHERPEAAMVTA